ncbi:MAG: PLP-dependent transferase [Fibrobacter sp.]|nr:PLP-dependent transferase [Fibrobacter sp.]
MKDSASAPAALSVWAKLGKTARRWLNPSVTTHIELNPELQAAADIHAETIRLSLGLEDPQDLIQDLVQAFEASAK